MSDAQVSDTEKQRLLAEIVGEPTSEAAPAPVSPAPVPRPLAAPVAAPPPSPSRIWGRRRLIAGVAMLAAGSAWLAMWMVSGRPAAAGLALLGIGAGAWVSLRPKKY